MSVFDASEAFKGGVPASRPDADPKQNPTVAAVLARATLRSLRLSRKLKQAAVATGTNMSASKLCKIETGNAIMQAGDAERLADFYHLPPAEKAWLVTLGQQASNPPAWQQAGLVAPPFMEQLVGLEPAAVRLWTYEADLISGLLQTEAYMRAVMASSQPPLRADEIEERVKLRLYRQAKVFADPPDCIFLFDESMLLRRIGSRETMVGQFDHLIGVAGNPRIQIRIVPLDGMQVLSGVCSMTLLDFGMGSTGLPSVIYLEVGDGGRYFVKGIGPVEPEEGAPSFDRHSTTLTMLLGQAAGRDESLEILKVARQRFLR
ncbi:helix-turn-helix domain-containing protein [Kitasatospora brasiliensis]|uniref:helix-turn-helix domain-containing protein n=1 Tax=Kitasatospora brasiliensis TaxID=3058040 RepID=UPI00292FA62D|nr:helix-turn-helix transcriptional regulator [Kitasatospora sp. K002]